MSNRIKVKCVVAGINPNSEEPDFYFVIVECTQEQFKNDEHRTAAIKHVETEGWECHLTFDEFDTAGSKILILFAWETASIICI